MALIEVRPGPSPRFYAGPLASQTQRSYTVITAPRGSEPAMPTVSRIIQVGNSRGVRLSKAALLESGLDGPVEVIARPGEITLRAIAHPRAGWAEAFAHMAGRGDDQPVWPETRSTWDDEEWTWP